MRYLSVPTYTCPLADGRVVTVHDMRDLTLPQNQLTPQFSMQMQADDDLDEIASRQYVYGDGGERESYKLHEMNAAALLDANYDLSKVNPLVVPS